MIRTFVAIHLPPEIIASLTLLSDRLGRGPGGQAGRWVPPENIHLTLKFLGDIQEAQLPSVFEAVEHACEDIAPFDIRLAGMGCFPNARRPRVVWVGIDDKANRLTELHRGIEQKLTHCGFAIEKRPFRPHLTLARIRRNASRDQAELLGASATKARLGTIGTFCAEAVHVVKSDLGPGGSRYTDLNTTQLSGTQGPQS